MNIKYIINIFIELVFLVIVGIIIAILNFLNNKDIIFIRCITFLYLSFIVTLIFYIYDFSLPWNYPKIL